MSGLPSELLAEIFLTYAVKNNQLHDLGWTKLLLVCRYWHDVGIGTPSLWARIVFDSQPLIKRAGGDPGVCAAADAREVRRVQIQCARAGDAPLSVRLRLDEKPAEIKRALLPIFWNPKNLTVLNIEGHRQRVEETLEAMALHSLPALISLDVSTNHFSSTPQQWSFMLSGVLKQCSSILRSISVRNVNLDWPFVNGLDYLSVRYPDDRPVPLPETLAALVRCPMLNRLSLTFPQSFIWNETASAHVPLLHLRTLLLKGHEDTCLSLLQALIGLPNSARIDVETLNGSRSFTPALNSIATYIGDHTCKLHSPIIQTLSFNVDDIGLMGWGRNADIRLDLIGQLHLDRYRPHSIVDDFVRYPQSPHSSLRVKPQLFNNGEFNMLIQAAQSWSLGGVTCVDLRSFDTFVPLDNWSTILKLMPMVHTIAVRMESDAARRLSKMLTDALHTHGKRPFANLILDVGFRNNTIPSLPPPFRPEPDIKAMQNTLMDVMYYCADAAGKGMALDTVEVVNDYQDAKYTLFAIGDDFDWIKYYEHLNKGFVYESVLHNASVGQEGVKWNSFGDQRPE